MTKGNKSYIKEEELLIRLKESIDKEEPLRKLEFNEEELNLIKGFNLLSLKPVLMYVTYLKKTYYIMKKMSMLLK